MSPYDSHLIFFYMLILPPTSTLFPYTTLFRSFLERPGKIRFRYNPPSKEEIVSVGRGFYVINREDRTQYARSEEHTSELQSRLHLVCRLLLEKKKKKLKPYLD